MEEECGNIPMVLVMTKMDLLYNATIDACEVQKLSQSLAVKLMKTSVKENLNISPVFEFLATQHLSELSQWSVDPPIIQVKIFPQQSFAFSEIHDYHLPLLHRLGAAASQGAVSKIF